MVFKWPFYRSNISPAAMLAAIYITPSAGQSMRPVNSIQAITNAGLAGDRYCLQCGFWKSIEACQVSLITEDDLYKARHHRHANFQHHLEHGSHRRNLVIKGLKTKALEGTSFRIGTAVFSYQKPRPPCGYLDKIEGKGMSRILAHNSGACIRVVESGTLSVGDAVVILDKK